MFNTRTLTLLFAFLGLLVPLAILAVKQLSAAGFSPQWIYFAWPTYFILGGLSGQVDATAITFLIVSIVLNIAIYAYVGSIFGRLLSAIRRTKVDSSSMKS